jgi:hypothetical protein
MAQKRNRKKALSRNPEKYANNGARDSDCPEGATEIGPPEAHERIVLDNMSTFEQIVNRWVP